MNEKLQQLTDEMRRMVEAMPDAMAQDEVIRRGLICFLAGAVRDMGLTPLMGWKPPRSTRDVIDLVAVDATNEVPKVEMAFAVDALVELPRLKALDWVECPHKVVVSFSRRADKVAQTSFFLGKQHTHLKLYA